MTTPEFCVQPTGRTLDKVLGHHHLREEVFMGTTVMDLGCGYSDLQGDLQERGIDAYVTGFDNNPDVVDWHTRARTSSTVKLAHLDNLEEVDDGSADVAIACFSLPLWGENAQALLGFFQESMRITRRKGILSIFPMVTHCRVPLDRSVDRETEHAERKAVVTRMTSAILGSDKWQPLTFYDGGVLTARKLS
jgi:ubiquinone/menaquinone biosynthesis C-methylase UbiE